MPKHWILTLFYNFFHNTSNFLSKTRSEQCIFPVNNLLRLPNIGWRSNTWIKKAMYNLQSCYSYSYIHIQSPLPFSSAVCILAVIKCTNPRYQILLPFCVHFLWSCCLFIWLKRSSDVEYGHPCSGVSSQFYISYMTLGKLLNLSVARFLIHKNWGQ